MSMLAPTLQAFFTERLMHQRQASPRTIEAYRDTFCLLLGFAHERTTKPPARLDFADLDAELIGDFLQHLEQQRHNSVRTRNARLAAIHSLFRFAALRHPEHAALVQRVLAIPPKRFDQATVSYLNPDEIKALISAPNRATWIGRRDHTLLVVAIQTGLRVSELTGLRCRDIVLTNGAHVRCQGKGRKQRCTPLTLHTAQVLRVWLRERGGQPDDPLFPSRRTGILSTDAVESLVRKYATTAAERCPSLRTKNITPHVLRHSAAMLLRQSGADSSVIALWLGHEAIDSVQVYLHADLALKERALARTAPPGTNPGRYHPPDSILAFLKNL
ncbi:MAG: tyrosine-type recombinase/integrase [Pseudonocardiaceae bacterium]